MLFLRYFKKIRENIYISKKYERIYIFSRIFLKYKRNMYNGFEFPAIPVISSGVIAVKCQGCMVHPIIISMRINKVDQNKPQESDSNYGYAKTYIHF